MAETSGNITVTYDPAGYFRHDPAAILKTLRLSVTCGLGVEKNTRCAMHYCASLIGTLPKETITDHMRAILSSGMPVRHAFMEFSDLIGELIPEIRPCIGADHNSPYHRHGIYEHILYVTDYCKPTGDAETDYLIRLAALLHDIGKPASRTKDPVTGRSHFYGHPAISAEIAACVLKDRFRLTENETGTVLTLIAEHDTMIAETEKSVKRAMNRMGKNVFPMWLVLKQADRDDHVTIPDRPWPTSLKNIKKIMDAVLEKENEFSIKNLAVNGNDVIGLTGIKEGPVIGQILNTLLDGVKDGTLENSKTVLSNAAKELAKTATP